MPKKYKKENETEIWVTHPKYEGYEFSSLGRIRSYWKSKTPILKSYHLRGDGYLAVSLRVGNDLIERPKVSRVILEAFKGYPEDPTLMCCHNNGNRLDDRICNLRWDTSKNNVDDMRKHGTMLVGSKHPNAKLTEEDVIQIKTTLLEYTSPVVAKMFNVSPRLIRFIRQGKQWRHING